MNATLTAEQWPGWAKALLIGQFALILAVLIPWVFMSIMCMGMGDMWRMMETMPRGWAEAGPKNAVKNARGASALVRFDPATETFTSFPHAANGNVQQSHGRPGEVFAPLSALDRILVITTR